VDVQAVSAACCSVMTPRIAVTLHWNQKQSHCRIAADNPR
jgi:hypothetical protein